MLFWAEAINTTIYLKNRSPTKILNNNTPKEDRKKIDAKAIKFIFISYCFDHKEYKTFDPSTHKVF